AVPLDGNDSTTSSYGCRGDSYGAEANLRSATSDSDVGREHRIIFLALVRGNDARPNPRQSATLSSPGRHPCRHGDPRGLHARRPAAALRLAVGAAGARRAYATVGGNTVRLLF